MKARQPGQAGTFLMFVAAGAVTALGIYMATSGVASYKAAAVERRWAETLGEHDEILERYPTTEANAVALELERLTAGLGVTTAPRFSNRAEPAADREAAYDAVHRDLGAWTRAELGQRRRALAPAPRSLLAFLAARASELEAVRRHLERGIAPRWEMDLRSPHAAPVPNLLGHLKLARLLVADALIRIRDGDDATAGRDLEAAWTLLQSVADSPMLICQLIAVVEAREIAGAVRQMERPAAAWRARLTEHDFRGAFTTALKFEGWVWTQIRDLNDFAGFTVLASRVLSAVAKPYVQYCLAEVSDDYRSRVANLEKLQAICDYDLASQHASLQVEVPRWNLVGGLVNPQVGDALDRLARLELDLELTVRLLDLEQARRDAGGVWPDSLPGGDASTACPRDRWVYEVAGDGLMTLAFERETRWPKIHGTLPNGFTIGPLRPLH